MTAPISNIIWFKYSVIPLEQLISVALLRIELQARPPPFLFHLRQEQEAGTTKIRTSSRMQRR
ncbi:MAG: hypothetical protein M3O24_01890 [Thermoproteota archaeon]|nr:hypothetical protein [Thermoproteota archaeon]